jgi:uncharacterized protein
VEQRISIDRRHGRSRGGNIDPAPQPKPEHAAPTDGPTLQALDLLIIQASPFCNLDCSYCYLPDRGDRRRMSMATLEALLDRVFAAEAAAPLSIVWHAGEPMAVPRSWYEDAFARIDARRGARPVHHHFQTNAVLIDAEWCAFFARHGVHVGVSLDGPAELHDRHRRTRDGHGTHARALQGVEALRATGLRFHAIAVLTRDSLSQADALFDFFAGLGVDQVGFNIEEIEAEHTASSLQGDDTPALYRAFWQRLLQRLREQPGRLRVREVDAVVGALRHPRFGQLHGNAQNLAGAMLNVSWDGRFTHWSPELLGGRHPRLGPIELGRVGSDDPFDAASLPRLATFQHEIDAGIAACRASCRYFDFCLGGAPANKLAELGSFAGTETMACRLGQQVVIDSVLEALDADLPKPGTP